MIHDLFAPAMDELRGNVRQRPWVAALSLLIAVSGLGIGAAGWAAGAVLLVVGLGLSAIVDRRLTLLSLALVLPTSTAYFAIPAFSIGGSTVDFRLLLTVGISVILGIQLVAMRPVWDPVSVAFATFVALLVLAAPLNEFAPARSLPPIARSADALLAYLVARRVVRSPGDAALIALAIVSGMLPVAASGLIQLFAGDALLMNDAARLSGVYRTSPVGLGMAMQLAMVIVWGVFLWRPLPRSALVTFALLFAVFAFVMVETSSRLVFVSVVLGLGLFELWRRRLVMATLVVVISGVILVAQPQLAGRLTSTAGAVTPAPSNPVGGGPPDGLDQDASVGDASVSYRLFLWGAMIPEWAQSPIVGRGTGSFAVLFERQGNQLREVAHNDYVSILVENGLLGLFLYLGVQLTVMVMLVVRARLQGGLVRDLAMTAAVVYLCLNILSVLNNPIFFLDLQVLLWMLVGSALAVRLSPDTLRGVAVLQTPASGHLSLVRDLGHALSIIWKRRPAILVTPQVRPGYRFASSLSGIPLQERIIAQ